MIRKFNFFRIPQFIFLVVFLLCTIYCATIGFQMNTDGVLHIVQLLSTGLFTFMAFYIGIASLFLFFAQSIIIHIMKKMVKTVVAGFLLLFMNIVCGLLPTVLFGISWQVLFWLVLLIVPSIIEFFKILRKN